MNDIIIVGRKETTKMQECIVLIGPPCSGKSTIGKALADKLGYKYVSSGDIARKMADEDGTTDSLNAGNMAPEDRMRNEIKKVFECENNIILDGFPRFYEQYKWMVKHCKVSLPFAFVVIDVSINELFSRVVNRNRADDVAIRERMNYYMEHTAPMISEIRKVSKTIDVNNNNPNIDRTVDMLTDYLRGRIW